MMHSARTTSRSVCVGGNLAIARVQIRVRRARTNTVTAQMEDRTGSVDSLASPAPKNTPRSLRVCLIQDTICTLTCTNATSPRFWVKLITENASVLNRPHSHRLLVTYCLRTGKTVMNSGQTALLDCLGIWDRRIVLVAMWMAAT